MLERDALAQRRELGRGQHVAQLGLTRQHDLQQLLGVGLEVREQPHLLEQAAVEVLRLVDHEHRVEPAVEARAAGSG